MGPLQMIPSQESAVLESKKLPWGVERHDLLKGFMCLPLEDAVLQHPAGISHPNLQSESTGWGRTSHALLKVSAEEPGDFTKLFSTNHFVYSTKIWCLQHQKAF